MTVPALPEKLEKILIVNIYGIGDVLFSTPFISNLKENFPGVQIGYICNNRTAPLLNNYSKVDKLFVYERDEFQQTFRRSKREFWEKTRSLIDRIREEKYDAVFDFSLNATFCTHKND